MRTGKKLWSLLLALVMIVSLFGGVFVVNAAGAVAVTPEATYGGAALTMTADGVIENYTFFDLATIGYGNAKQYAFWFETGGTFSFNQDVAIAFQGAPKADLKAGETYSASDFSECYVTLDDGNMLVIVDQDKPGNYASLSPDQPFSSFPGAIAMPGAAPAAEEPAEEPAEEEPAAAVEGFAKTDALEVGKQYVIVAEYGGKYYALAYDGAVTAVEVTVADDAVAAADALIWTLEDGNQAQSAASAGVFLYPYASGMTYSSGRNLLYENEKLYFITSDGTPGYVSFDGAKFGYVKGDDAAAAKILLFAGETAAEPAAAPAAPAEFPEPETVYRSAVKNADGSITLAFTSDVHYDGVNLNLKTWLDNSGVGYIDAFGFCGDMGSAYATTAAQFWGWTGGIMDYMDSLVEAGKLGDAVYTMGNHEWFPSAGGDYLHEYANYEAAGRMMQVGPAVVTDDYIIYCFGAGRCVGESYLNDYMEEDIAELDAWLETAPTGIPIFILTHFPLHFWYNTRYAPHAVDVIDVLNKYSDDHEIVFFWGHNHSDYDDGYYQPRFPGDEIRVDAAGNMRTLNFIYMGAGTTADGEYTGPSYGSASVMNKGLIVTINADKTLDFTYYTLNGDKMYVGGPWLIRFRAGFDEYETLLEQYVDDGQTVTPPDAPEREGYAFVGWYYWNDYSEVPFDFAAPITRNYLITAKYTKVLLPVAAPDAADCVTVKPDADLSGTSLTVTAAGVGDLITTFDLASIGYGTGIMYGFWFTADGMISFDRDVTLLYQGSATDFTLKAGEFYSTEGFGEHYVRLDDGNSFLILEYDAPGNYASLPGTHPYADYPGTVTVGGGAAPAPVEPEPEPAPVEPEPAAEGATYYTVQEGDTIRSISKMFYGTIFKWRLIYEANYDSMVGTDMIYVGQVLLIP